MKNTHKYDDIIHLPHYISQKRTRMPNYDRAAQFSPFAALTGYDGVIRETARLTEGEIELDEGGMALLNEKLLTILERIDEKPPVTLKCFQPDIYKDGGSYVYITGRVKRIDDCAHALLLTDGRSIPMDRIYAIEPEG